MPVSFRYAVVEICGTPVFVDRKRFGEAKKALQDALRNIDEISEDILGAGFVLQTPDGMTSVNLGSPLDLADWMSNKMGSSFSFKDAVGSLPSPFKEGLQTLTGPDVVLYSAALFYTGGTSVSDKNLYGELVVGFKVPDDFMQDFPLALREIVIEVNNYE